MAQKIGRLLLCSFVMGCQGSYFGAQKHHSSFFELFVDLFKTIPHLFVVPLKNQRQEV